MSASQVLLEEKYTRAMAFGKYLDQHPDNSENNTTASLHTELQRSVTVYRIALHNVLQDRLNRAGPKRGK